MTGEQHKELVDILLVLVGVVISQEECISDLLDHGGGWGGYRDAEKLSKVRANLLTLKEDILVNHTELQKSD